MAFTKERKTEIIAQYEQWMSQSQAVFILEYKKMDMKAVGIMRAKVRDAGGELHVVKNTLFNIVLEKAGMQKPKGLLDGTTMISFAFSDPPALAKVITDSTKNSEIFKVKAGYFGKQAITAPEIKALADLPPLPVMRAKVLGMLLAPASKLVRTLAEPARSLAGVVKAYSEKSDAPAEIPADAPTAA